MCERGFTKGWTQCCKSQDVQRGLLEVINSIVQEPRCVIGVAQRNEYMVVRARMCDRDCSQCGAQDVR